MAIDTILTQPATHELRAAYQSTFIEANDSAGSRNAVVYFDIYFGGVYYKTITTTTPVYEDIFVSNHRADIKDAIQEYLRSIRPSVGMSNITKQNESVSECYVKVRGSSVSGTGIITPDGTVPKQGTVGQAPQAGTGTQTNTFIVLNMAIQHEDHQSAASFLANTPWSVAATYPFLMLSKNAMPSCGMSDYGYVGLYFDYPAAGVIMSSPLALQYFVRVNGVDYFPIASNFNFSFGNVYYLPVGISNIRLMATGSGIPFYTATSYQVGLALPSGGAKVLTSPPIKIDHNSSSERRAFFRNYLGHYEALSFIGGTETMKAVSGTWEKPYTATYPNLPAPTSGNKAIRGSNRFNVRSNEMGTLLGSFQEEQMWLVAQLAGSPDAYLQWKGTYGQSDDLLPINILDDNLDTVKADERYSYDVALKFEMANPNIHTRS